MDDPPTPTALSSGLSSASNSRRGRHVPSTPARALFGERPPTQGEIPAADEEALRAAGLSRPKVSYLRDLARHVTGGDLDLGALYALSDDEVIGQITAVKGLGRWSADMFMSNRPT